MKKIILAKVIVFLMTFVIINVLYIAFWQF